MIHLGDITKISGYDIPIVDVITGGSPCQDLSVAGKRAGLDGERSGLFMEQIRIVKEMREHDRRSNGRPGWAVRPRFMVWENVPGAFSSNKGQDFQAVLTEIVRIEESNAPDVPMPDKGKWPKSGCLYDEMGRWSVAWRVHDAQFWGVPQRRKRIALVADFGGLSASEVLFVRKGLSWDSAESGTKGEGASSKTEDRTGETSRRVSETAWTFDHVITTRGNCTAKGPCYYKEECPTSKAGGTHAVVTVNENQKNTNSEVGGFDGSMGAKAGGIGYEKEISPTLNAGKIMHCLNDQGGSAMNVSINVSGALRAEEHGHQPIVYGSSSFGKYKEGVTTLRAQGGDNGGGSENIVSHRAVRKLTPLECERLQGFPDGWTDIGEWTDSKGKAHKESSDAVRYKALGNSIATPFWFYLLRRISAQYERPATLGSLFDGIGGFPYCWEKCNGKGTAIWASEIEEFPIAVTKKHFSNEED